MISGSGSIVRNERNDFRQWCIVRNERNEFRQWQYSEE